MLLLLLLERTSSDICSSVINSTVPVAVFGPTSAGHVFFLLLESSLGQRPKTQRVRMARWLPVLSLAAVLSQASGIIEERFVGDPCTLYSGEPGVCARATECAWLRPALRAHEITYEQLVKCEFEGNDLVICCRAPPTKASRVGVRPSVQACATYDGTQPQLAYHIIAGSKAQEGDVPFIAALGYRPPTADDGPPTGAGYLWACGSSLITVRFLLTAAHCIRTPHGMPVVARMGTIDLLSPPVPADVQDRAIKNIIVHPQYRNKYDDIALLEVTDPFQMDVGLQPVCLRTDTAEFGPDVVLQVAGWGQTEESASSAGLLRANLSTVPVAECDRTYAGAMLAKVKSIRPSQYCARGFRAPGEDNWYSDSCEGDSGGPLYHVAGEEGSSKYYLVGVTSFGLGCGSSTPSVYTRVAYYLDWIESHVWPEDGTT
uniref:Peptidase S1 domain-containing protein n=1 Tax=Anopheles merus TaxID=30066 RepID=A0A182V5G8_ANOME